MKQLDWIVNKIANQNISKFSTYVNTRTFNIWSFRYVLCKLWTQELSFSWLSMLLHPFQIKMSLHALLYLEKFTEINLFFIGYLHTFMDGCSWLYLMSMRNISWLLKFWYLIVCSAETKICRCQNRCNTLIRMIACERLLRREQWTPKW